MTETKTQVDSVTPLPWKVISGGQNKPLQRSP